MLSYLHSCQFDYNFILLSYHDKDLKINYFACNDPTILGQDQTFNYTRLADMIIMGKMDFLFL